MDLLAFKPPLNMIANSGHQSPAGVRILTSIPQITNLIH